MIVQNQPQPRREELDETGKISALVVGKYKTLPDVPAPALEQEQASYGVFAL